MEKQKRWQLFLIIAVIILTVYNILPTVFYYSKPLKKPINTTTAKAITEEITDRTNKLEIESVEWLDSFCSLLSLKPLSISPDTQNAQFVNVTFKNADDANKFRKHLPRAGALIVFAPAQLSLYDEPVDSPAKTVTVQRRIPIHFDDDQLDSYFQFSSKTDSEGNITDLWKALVNDRALQLGNTIGGVSENAQYVQGVITHVDTQQGEDLAIFLAQNILGFARAFGEDSSIVHRYFASFSQADVDNRRQLIQNFIGSMERIKDKIKLERIALEEESKNLQSQGSFLDTPKQQKLELLLNHEKTLSSAETVIKKNISAFSAANAPFSYSSFGGLLQETYLKMGPGEKLQTIPLEGRNPFIRSIVIDWGNEEIYLQLHDDFADLRNALEENKKLAYQKDQVDQFLYNEIAYIARQSGETITPYQNGFTIALNQLQNSKSFLTMRLAAIAKAQIEQLKQTLLTHWAPQHPDLSRESFPIYDEETFASLPLEEKTFGLVLYAPSTQRGTPPKGFRMNSIYVIAKGLDKILMKFRSAPDSEQAQRFMQDFNSLRAILQRNGLFGYSAANTGLSQEYANDFIFEGEDYFNTVLKATRENFSVHGTKRYALLEFSDLEQRILTENKIETRMHEDLLKWRDDYKAAQLNIRGISSYDVPQPTSNVLWDNFKLSFIKFFRGDDRKILHWGLDLSGGKTVQIELRDHNNRPVTNETDIKQGINELYNRVNKMGVSEVSIRQEGNYITLDFPGSQGLSAAELVKASSMYFHVVNEKFAPGNANLAESVDRFLQDVWNEAVVTNRKDSESINMIAFKHLYGETLETNVVQPRSEAAKILYDNGLRLTNPLDTISTSIFNDTSSKIAIFRGDDFTEWQGQTHPLLIVFRNYALEGSNLENIQASYDPSKGNFLAFAVSGSQSTRDGIKSNPRDDLHAWTSRFSKEKIAGTDLEPFTKGKGWRMAVILNGTIISAPTLDSALRDSAMITGSFTQREVNQLEADLKAGSLSFTPRILSEKNVSPELGSREKSLGFVATAIALVLVIAVMVTYYRFGGLIASIAVIFNLLIMWGVLQNLHATLTLASIAGLILTVGTAVDANVLVFERIREEFKATGRIASAVHAGYRKAFSAIIDSNLTTIIAAMILLHFDSGPIKAFAITLIIGILSSMFTALFMTRYFFAGWVKNPKNKVLKMMDLIKSTHFDFLKFTKPTILLSTIVILVGGYFLISQRHQMLGMDFTGGYAVNIELKAEPGMNYRQAVEKALVAGGASTQDFQIRELTPPNNIRLFLSRNMEQPGRPFYGMPMRTEVKDVGFAYESNPKLIWIVQSLEGAHLSISPGSLQHLDANWSEVSGQMSDSMRNNALIGLFVALVCILIYITARFEFKYAISATICLAHDIVFTVAAIAILHFFKVPIQIDLNTVAALMTIVGYSLNDTIIVFDRIREDIRLMRKSSFKEIINHAVNVTLSRTTMTSGTTLLVLLPLVALGGSTIFGFALVMAIGVIFGTLSSLFIAAPLMQYFHLKEIEKEQRSIQPNGKEFIL